MVRSYHLALADEWRAASDDPDYAPSAFEREGFIHLTDGADEMVTTANRHYRDHPGPFVVLEIDLSLVDAHIRYEDQRGIYPHIYGRLPRAAVVAESEIARDEGGTFLSIGDAT